MPPPNAKVNDSVPPLRNMPSLCAWGKFYFHNPSKAPGFWNGKQGTAKVTCCWVKPVLHYESVSSLAKNVLAGIFKNSPISTIKICQVK
jgi:hypothetical protein